ncbi:MAG: DUF4292 domain-containing protein [Bacteroidota bacterium]
MIIKNLLVLGSLIFLASCATNRLAQNEDSTKTRLKKRSTNYLLKKLKSNELDAEWLSAKARITFKDENQTRKFTANIRMRKDSVIWMNVKKINVEVARILVTKDSIFIINRLDKEYYVQGMDFLEERFNLPGQFDALQTAILGNPYFFQKQKLTSDLIENQYQLSSNKTVSRMQSEYRLNGKNFALEQMTFTDDERSRQLSVLLSGYEQLMKGFNFAHNRDFLVDSDETGEASISMKLSKVEINEPKTIRFSISSRYKRVEEIRE